MIWVLYPAQLIAFQTLGCWSEVIKSISLVVYEAEVILAAIGQCTKTEWAGAGRVYPY